MKAVLSNQEKMLGKKNWMTPALLKSRRTKEKLFKKYQEQWYC